MDPKTNLNILDLPNIFQSLADNRRTGTLKVKARNQEKSVYFKDGCIQMVHTPLKSTILGEALIKTKSISEETLLKAVENQRKTKKRLGGTLIEMGAITEAQLVAALTFQISEEVCELFTWEDIHCEFIAGNPLPGALSLDEYTSQITLNAGALMMEAARRIDEWELIKKTLPSTRDVLVLNQKLPAKFKGTLRHELVKWVDGMRDVEEVSERARMSKFNALKLIRDLTEEKFLRAKTAAELVKTAKAVQSRGGPKDQNLAKIIRLYERSEELGIENPKLSLWLAKAYGRLNQNLESATRYKSLGRESLEKGNLQEAAGHYLKIVQMNAEDLESHRKLVDTYLKLQDHERAVHQTLELLDKLKNAGQIEEAASLGVAVRDAAPQNTRLLEAMAELQLDCGDNIQALIEYEGAAEIHLEGERYEDAIRIYERMLDIDDENIDAYFKLAGALTKIGRTDEAVKRYQTLANTLTSSGVLEDSINWQFLINVYENIVAIEPTNIMAREWLVDAYISKTDTENALSHLQGLLEALGENGDPQKKITALQKMIRFQPENYQNRRTLGNVFRHAGMREEAVDEFGELSALAVKRGDYDVALSASKEVLSVDPFDVDTIASIGKIYEIAGRYPEASAEFRKAALLFGASNRRGKAVQHFVLAAETDPEQNGCLLEAAEMERLRSNNTEALDLYHRFVTGAVKAKNYGLARTACNIMLSLKNDDPWARDVLEQIERLPDREIDA